MVLTNKIRFSAGIATFLVLALVFSCEKTFPGLLLCRDCLDSDPLMANLELRLNADNKNGINIEIYEGNLDDSILYKTYATGASSASVFVPINKKYTIVAKYFITGYNYYVINSVTPHSKYDEVQCEKPCYIVVNNKVDMRLKHVR